MTREEVFEALGPAAAAAAKRWSEDEAYASMRGAVNAMIEAAATSGEALDQLEDAFCRVLPIGTGGRRGPVGPGPNRMNEIVLRETATGLANWVREAGAPMSAVVVYDTRRESRRFAHVVAHALAAEGMQVRLLDAPRPTPQLSFELRRHQAGAGVVISASHNPPTDNGIKIYGSDGAQVLGADDRALMEAITAAAGRFAPIDEAALEAGRFPDAVELVDPRAASDAEYHAFVLAQGVSAARIEGAPPIAYTPLHGVGQSAVVPVLEAKGFAVHVVESQLDDGGEFGTVASANPEAPAALERVTALARECGAPIALANDPDADRLGATVRDAAGEYHFVDGNRLGVLMLDHLLRHAPRPAGARVIETLVTTPLLATMARAMGIEAVDDILVGFKHHAGLVREDESKPVFFMCEESHGYTRGSDVRDKDGAVAALLLAEAAADAAAAGETLFDRLDAVWRTHGYHREKTQSLWAHGAAGREAIAAVMSTLRETPPTQVAGLEVREVVDRLTPRHTGSTTRDLPGNVLVFELAGAGRACRVVLRPSGTEPKLKVYALARGPVGGEARDEVDALIAGVLEAAEALARKIMDPLL